MDLIDRPDGTVSFPDTDGKVSFQSDDKALVSEKIKDPIITPRKWDSFRKEVLIPELKDLISPLSKSKTVEDASVDLMLKLLIVQLTLATRAINYFAQQLKEDRLNIQQQTDDHIKNVLREITPEKAAEQIVKAFDTAKTEQRITDKQIPHNVADLLGMMRTLGKQDDALTEPQKTLKKELQKIYQVETLSKDLFRDDRTAGVFAKKIAYQIGLMKGQNVSGLDGRKGVLSRKVTQIRSSLYEHTH